MDEEVDLDRRRVFEQSVLRPDDLRLGCIVLERQTRSLAATAAFVGGFRRPVFGKMLVSAVGPQHVGSAHPADAAMVAVMRGAGRIVGGQVVERRRHARRIEVIPERHSLALEHGPGQLVIERPEIELNLILADIQASFTRDDLGCRVDGSALLGGVAVDEVENTVVARPGPVDEVGPGDGALRRRAGAQRAEPAAGASFSRLGSKPCFIMRSESRGSIPSIPMTITFLPALCAARRRLPSQ